ncbi:trypsin-like peptidase domain-containing protein [Antarctobacter sp.]|uniref:trypsin-like peptidase domain-containing protein n=1 Tax=Antarctobacter sp. TaxID=1872577 RepID=UPI002B270A85|nr:trypsin-like peptidase domain-containing protein [Antarctobacter sp.]
MTRVRRLFRLRFGLFVLWAVAHGGGAAGQGLPVFDGSEFDHMVMESPARVVARNRARIKDSGAKPVIRYTPPTVARQAARGVGQVRVEVQGDNGSFVAACTGFLVAETLLLTAHRCGPGLLDDPSLSARKPTGIARIDFIAGYDAPRESDQGSRFPVEVTPLEMDAAAGYAVLRVKTGAGTPLPLSTETLPTATPLMILAHPFGESLFVWRDGCSLRSAGAPGGRLSLGCATLPGSAGAPVLDDKGQVIAMHLDERGQGGRAVAMASLIERSTLLLALAQGETCVGELAVRCGLAPPEETPDPVVSPLGPEVGDPAMTLDRKDADIVVQDEDPTKAFPVGLTNGKPTVYAVALPYLPPGTGIDLMTGPVGDLTGPEARLTAGATEFAATVTRLGKRHAVLSLWRAADGSLAARRYIPPGAEVITLSPDGQRLALARRNDADDTWSIEMFKLPALDPLPAIGLSDAGPVTALAFSPDATRLAVAQAGKAPSVSIWQGETGARQWHMTGAEAVTGLRYSLDGRLLALAMPDGVALHEVETGALLRGMAQADGPALAISGLAFTGDGTALIAGAEDAEGLRWAADTGTLAGRIGPVQGGRLLGLNATGNAAVFLSSVDGAVRLFGLDDGVLLRSLEGRSFTDAALTPDGAHLIGHVRGAVSGLVFADPNKGEAPVILYPDGDFVSALAFSPDSSRLALGGSGRPDDNATQRLQIWSWQDGKVTFANDGYGPGGPVAMAWRPDGAALAVQGGGIPLRLYDFSEGGEPRELGDASLAASLAFGEAGDFLIRVPRGGPVALVDAQTGAQRRSWAGEFAALSPEGAVLAIGRNAPTPEIILADPATGETQLMLEMPFSRVGPLAYRGEIAEIIGLVQDSDQPDTWGLALWNAENGQLLRRFGELDHPPHAMRVSPDGRFVAVSEEGMAQILLWDISVDRFLWRLETGGAEVRALAFSPDGLRIAAGLAPAGVVLWDMIDGQVKARLAPFSAGTVVQVGATLFLSDPALLDRVAVRLPDGVLLPASQVLREGLPDFVPADLPLEEQVAGLLDRLRAGDDDARLLLVDGRALAFDLDFRREVQRQLKAAEFYSGPIDGDIGRGSRRALEQFAADE